jgi:CubicO group peptidase (beta-lactamase class C family)
MNRHFIIWQSLQKFRGELLKNIFLNALRTCLFVQFFTIFVISNSYSQTTTDKVESLISTLSNKTASEKTRLDSASELGAMKTNDTVAIKSLIECFSDENLYLRGKAATALGKIGKPVVHFLIKALQDKNENVRWSASIALSKMGMDAAEAVQPLAQSLNDTNENVRWCSLIALGNIGAAASSCSVQISKLLHDDNEDIRWAAIFALNRVSPKEIEERTKFDFVIQTIESLTLSLMKELKIPGVSVCLIKDRKIAWSNTFGIKDDRIKEQVTKETMFEACSMSKPVFAYLVLKLTDEKKLDLDKPLSDYLDEKFIALEDYTTKITARMVLYHTSGLPNWRKGFEETEGPLAVYFEPGTKFSYSGEGYYYLQRVIEKITGEPLDVFARKNLLEPLGLTHTSYSWTKEIDSNISAGHDTTGKFFQKTKYTQSNAAYSLYTTPQDYAAFMCNILNNNASRTVFLSEKNLDEMMNHQVDVNIREPISRPGRALGLGVYWGLGWAIDSTVTGNIVYHSGANQSGFRCYSQFNYKEGTAIVIMTNGLNGGDLWRRLIRKIGDF